MNNEQYNFTIPFFINELEFTHRIKITFSLIAFVSVTFIFI